MAVLPAVVVAVARSAGRSAESGVLSVTAVAADGQEHRYALPAADGVLVDSDNQVILVRRDGRVMAFNLACPHENTALRWRRLDDRFQCPRHESKYRPDGTFIEGRATRHMDRLAIRRDGDHVVVDLGRMIRSDQEPDAWAAASVDVT
jgi:nitrite reductase/ring-hydroxylating ferredoxin subunit